MQDSPMLRDLSRKRVLNSSRHMCVQGQLATNLNQLVLGRAHTAVVGLPASFGVATPGIPEMVHKTEDKNFSVPV